MKHFWLILGLSFSISVMAGETGTLLGKVIDAKSGQPLAGVQISLLGTELGTISDSTGHFALLNIPPGRYDVRFQMIGYTTQIQQKVPFLIDLQTRLEVALEPTVLQGEPVLVQAAPKEIRKDLTGTARFMGAKQLEALPVVNYEELLDLQAGVVAGHIRGGRTSEVLYLVDGIPIQEVVEGKAGSKLPTAAVKDISLQTGGFSAEYGNAMSGVVNILTKEGTGTPYLKLGAELIDNSREEHPFPGEVNPDLKVELISGGPLGANGNYFLATELKEPQSNRKREEFGLRRQIPLDLNASHSFNLFSNLSTRLQGGQLKLNGQVLLSLDEWREYEEIWRYNLLALPLRERKSLRVGFNVVHSLNTSLFYDVRLTYYTFLKSILGSDLAVRDVPQVSDSGYVLNGQYPWWMDHQEDQLIFKADLTSQLNQHQQLRTGVSFIQYMLYKHNVMREDLGLWSAGYPIYIVYDSEYRYRPRQAAWYIQDKLEAGGVIINVGLRWDLFDPRASRPAIEFPQTSVEGQWVVDTVGIVKARIKQRLSPRFGIAWLLPDESKFRFNYGYFFQMPVFDYLYANPNLNIANGFAPLGNPDLQPALTKAWEFGYLVNNSWGSLDIVIFNKEASNLIDSNTLLIQEGDYSKTGFTRYVNTATAIIKGLEIHAVGRLRKYFKGELSYTLMKALGTGSRAVEALINEVTQVHKRAAVYPLSWDQRHTFVAQLEWQGPHGFSSSAVYRYGSPLPYTYYEGRYTQPNNARMHTTSTLDLHWQWQLELGSKLRVNLFTEVLNVLDKRNILWMDFLGRPGGLVADPSAWDLRRRFRAGVSVEW